MKKSKHYRKDVIIARVVFGLVCIALVTLLVLLGTLLSKRLGDGDTEGSQQESPVSEDTESDWHTVLDDDSETETGTETDTGSETEEEPEIYGKITASALKFRSEPNTDCEVLATLPNGTKVLILEELDGWYKASYDGQEGYLSADYVEIIESEQGASRETNGYIVMIDPGHQLHGDSTTEPNGPGSSVMKARVTSGTTGKTTGVDEYVVNLDIGLALRDELEARGYTVYMTREVHEVSISNKERAEMANALGADITIRIHCNGAEDTSISGALCMAPSKDNPYVSDIAAESQRLSQCVVDAYCEETGMINKGLLLTDTMTGINWCEMPVTIIEMGFMSNPSDDTNMQDADFRVKMVQGMADGIDDYFGL